jgi:Uma2 family endonuclease
MTAVQLKFGPADHGRLVTADELATAEYEEGFKYEVIDGRLYVSAAPNMPENFLEMWLRDRLWDHVRVANAPTGRVTTRARVFVPGRPRLTVPEPDVAVYLDYPVHTPVGQLRWENVSPQLVAEVLVEGDPRKDLERNTELYLQVPSVGEYWVLDGRDNPDEPILIQHRRYGKRWVVRTHPFGSTLTTKLLPGFSLLVDPRK